MRLMLWAATAGLAASLTARAQTTPPEIRFDSVPDFFKLPENTYLGEVAGIYSDLLLHDMGPNLASSGQYGGSNLLAGDGPSDQVDPLPIVIRSGTEARGKKIPKFGAPPRGW